MLGAATILFASALPCDAETNNYTQTLSPNGKYIVAAEGSLSSPRSIYIATTLTRKNVGWVIPPAEAGISNVAIQASWNDENTAVVLLTFFGAKGGDFAIYRKQSAGTFAEVKMDLPDGDNLKEGKMILAKGGQQTASEQVLGRWIDDHSVALLNGTAFVMRDNTINQAAAEMIVSIVPKVEVKIIRTWVATSEEEANTFINAWKRKYDVPRSNK